MLISSGDCIVIEVVDDQGVAICWQLNVELQKKGRDGTGRWVACREGKKNVSTLVDEVEKNLGSQ